MKIGNTRVALSMLAALPLWGCWSSTWYSGDGAVHTNTECDHAIVLPAYELQNGAHTFKIRHPPSGLYEPGLFVRDESSLQSARGLVIRMELRREDGLLIVERHGRIGAEWLARPRHQRLVDDWRAYIGALYDGCAAPLRMSALETYTLSISSGSESDSTTLFAAPVLLDTPTVLP